MALIEVFLWRTILAGMHLLTSMLLQVNMQAGEEVLVLNYLKLRFGRSYLNEQLLVNLNNTLFELNSYPD